MGKWKLQVFLKFESSLYMLTVYAVILSILSKPFYILQVNYQSHFRIRDKQLFTKYFPHRCMLSSFTVENRFHSSHSFTMNAIAFLPSLSRASWIMIILSFSFYIICIWWNSLFFIRYIIPEGRLEMISRNLSEVIQFRLGIKFLYRQESEAPPALWNGQQKPLKQNRILRYVNSLLKRNCGHLNGFFTRFFIMYLQ